MTIDRAMLFHAAAGEQGSGELDGELDGWSEKNRPHRGCWGILTGQRQARTGRCPAKLLDCQPNPLIVEGLMRPSQPFGALEPGAGVNHHRETWVGQVSPR